MRRLESALCSAMLRCTSTAHWTASTTLANSTSAPSPVSLTVRPRCSAILGSMRSLRSALSRACVPALVLAHQPTVADHIGGENRGELAVELLRSHRRGFLGATCAICRRRGHHVSGVRRGNLAVRLRTGDPLPTWTRRPCAGTEVGRVGKHDQAGSDRRPPGALEPRPGGRASWSAVRAGPALSQSRRSAAGRPVRTYAAAIVFGGPQSANDDHLPGIRAELDWLERTALGAETAARDLPRRPDDRARARVQVGPHPDGLVEIGYHPVHPTAAGAPISKAPRCSTSGIGRRSRSPRARPSGPQRRLRCPGVPLRWSRLRRRVPPRDDARHGRALDRVREGRADADAARRPAARGPARGLPACSRPSAIAGSAASSTSAC